jgi:hypothetical protein
MVLVVEPLNVNTGLGLRMGTWLLERGFAPKYAHIGTHREGSGGLWEHAYHQVPYLFPKEQLPSRPSRLSSQA